MKNYKYYIILTVMLAIVGAGIIMAHTSGVYAQTTEDTAEKNFLKTEVRKEAAVAKTDAVICGKRDEAKKAEKAVKVIKSVTEEVVETEETTDKSEGKPEQQMIGLTATEGFAEAAKGKTIEKLNEAGDIWQASAQLIGLTEAGQFAEKIEEWYEDNGLSGLALFSLNADKRSDIPGELTGVFNPDMVIELSDEEKNLLQRLVEAEAGTEGVYGKIIVANVVLNRLNNGKMGGDTITEVIYAKIGGAVQFSPTVKKSFNSIKVTKETVEAVDRALSGEDYSQGAMWFYGWKRISEKKTKWFWNNTEFLFTYKNVTYFGKK